jgi:N-acetylmuramoyl-L-alanine amidase
MRREILIGGAVLAVVALGVSMNKAPMINKPQPIEEPNKLLVILDPGHSTVEPGVSGGGNAEHIEAVKMSLTLKTLLEKQGLTVRLTHTGGGMVAGSDANAEIRARAALVRQLKPAAFVSVHYNMVNSYGLVYYPQDKRAAAMRLCRLIHRNCKFPADKLWSSATSRFGRLGILDDQEAPSALWEVAAIDDAKDSPEWRVAMATPVVNAITEFLGWNA